jgi:cytidyltransferase-like protein
MKTLYTGGSFDGFHLGHVHFLKQCFLLADRVVVALNTDDFIEQFKRKPLFHYEEREKHLIDFGVEVVPNIGGQDSKPSIEKVDPDIIAIGSDWASRDYYAQMQFTQEWLDEKEIVLVYLPYYPHISTTEIIKRCQSR